MMERLSSNLYSIPQWVQPKTFKNRFELRSGELLFATLDFESAFKTLATGTAVDGKWLFNRVGFFNMHVIIQNSGEAAEIGGYRPRWTGTEGQIRMANGAQFTWKSTNFWATRYVIQSADGTPLIYFESGIEDGGVSDWFKTQAQVKIQPAAGRLNELSLLVLLGWYLIILRQQDSAAAAA